MEFRDIESLIDTNKIEEFKSILNEDLNYYVNLEDNYKRTLLSHASSHGSLEFVKFLVENGADIDHKDNSDYTPIQIASEAASIEVVKYLFDLNANIDIAPRYSSYGIIGRLILEDEAKDLVKKIIDKKKSITDRDLEDVFYDKSMDIVKYIIEKKGVVPAIIVDSIKGFLYKENDEIIEFLEYLLDGKYIDINEKSSLNESFFHIVLHNVKDLTVPKYLVERGIDLNANANGLIGLFSMASKSCFEGVKYFVEQGVDINLVSSNNENALHSESSRYLGYNPPKEKKLTKTLEYLIDNGCDISLLSNSNRLPIYHLHYNKRTVSVKYLFEKTIDSLLAKDILDKDKFKALFSMQHIASTKKEKEMLIDSFSKFPKLTSQFVNQLNDEKTKAREMAVKVLIEVDDDKNLQILKERSEVESNKSLLKVLNEYLSTKKDLLDSLEEKKVLRNPKDFKKNSPEYFDVLAENEEGNIPVSWLKLNDLPDVLWEKSNKKMEIITVKYLLKKLKDNNLSNSFIKLINSNSLVELFNILHSMPSKINKDDMWIYNILFMLAENDISYLKLICENLDRFISYSRWAMGTNLFTPMINMKNDAGIKKVDWYSRKMKHKGVKNAAHSSLRTKAISLNMTVEELRDTLISDFGFNEDKELVLDYGTRKITVKLMADFKYTFKDDTDKTFKTLPKPNKKDKDKIANKSIKFFKEMKKEIKDILKIQKERIEAQIKVNTFKEFAKWEAFYVKNPVLNIFASNLFWGIYDDKNKLKTIFRYNEDHSFSDINDEEVRFKDSDRVGLIHPVELKEKELDKLKELIEDYEIIQPLEQIARKVFTTDSKEKELTDFENLKLYTKSSHYKLLSLGWERGYIVDNGWFEDYRMKFSGLIVSLDFSGADMYLEYGDETVTWGKVKFGTKMLKSVSKRAYSEVYRSLDIASQNRVE